MTFPRTALWNLLPALNKLFYQNLKDTVIIPFKTELSFLHHTETAFVSQISNPTISSQSSHNFVKVKHLTVETYVIQASVKYFH